MLHEGRIMSLTCFTSEHKRARIEAGAAAWTDAEIATAASLEATLKRVVANPAALALLVNEATLAQIAGWARVSRAFYTLLYCSDALWHVLLDRRVWKPRYIWMPFFLPRTPPGSPVLLAEKMRVVTMIRPCVYIYWKFVYDSGAPEQTSVETYTAEQICLYSSFRVFLQTRGSLHYGHVHYMVNGHYFRQKCRVDAPQYCTEWVHNQENDDPMYIYHTMIWTMGMNLEKLVENLFQGHVLRIYMECAVTQEKFGSRVPKSTNRRVYKPRKR